MAKHNQVGLLGENIAKDYLKSNGYKILEQNYKTKYAEIDLICSQNKTLVFIEVRTKIGENFGTPEDTINKAKLRKILWNAKSYSAFKQWNGPCRIDAICIVLKPDNSISRLTHHENVVN